MRFTPSVLCLMSFLLMPLVAQAQEIPSATNAQHYEKVVLAENLADPMEIAVTNDGRVFITERTGAVKLWEPGNTAAHVVAWLPVAVHIEDGLHGITLDPNFDENQWVYIYYSVIWPHVNRLSRFTFKDGVIDLDSEAILLDIPVQRERCCHSGGSLAFDGNGNLFLSVGNNGGRMMPELDEPGKRSYDSYRTSANTNDLRGKILRITPQPDGSYTIPEGNLFTPDDKHRGEIYTMGHRNPYRIAVDQKNGWLYWGDVGPGHPLTDTTPWGWDEYNQAREPGFFGFPMFLGPNDAYHDWNYETGEREFPMDPANPVNKAPTNTGATVLPPAQPAMIWYYYSFSEEFPELGAGGASPNAGPVYNYNPETAGPHGLPAHYDGKWFITEWMRHWVQTVSFDQNGDLEKIEPFLPGMTFVRPMDMEIGSDGRPYLIEWGDEFWGANANAQLVRIDYYGSEERPPAPPPPPPLPAASFTWPPEGGVIDLDAAIPYTIESEVATIMQPFTAFDAAELPLEAHSSSNGAVTIGNAHEPWLDMYILDRYAVLEAHDEEGRRLARVRLQPRHLEAEHAEVHEKARRITHGTHPASEHFKQTNLTTITLQPEGSLKYHPINLTNIDAVTIRYRLKGEGSLEIRQGDVEGAMLTSVSLTENGDLPSQPQMRNIEALSPISELVANLDRAPYENWAEVTVTLDGSTESLPFVLLFNSAERTSRVDLDWLQFHGAGVHLQP